ncbi:MAG: thiamine diphosphokinase [Firmicutes bacterium]|nr:thiamine diphosphokinase [Bacillota bacterium]
MVAADGGADLAKEIGLAPNVVVGDMDSLSMEGQRELAEAGCRFITHPVEKDQTDTHLAMQWACGFGFTEISVLMNRSGRLDHVLGIIWAAYGLVEKGVSVRFVDAQFEAVLVKGPASVDIRGPKKLLVSLLPLCDSADGITLNGMKYSLKGESLRPGETRGISNETMDSEARVEVGKGTLLVMVSGSTG